MPRRVQWSGATARLFIQRNKRLVRAVRGGMTVADAARAFGIGLRRAYFICYREGVTFGHRGQAGAVLAAARTHRAIAAAAREGLTIKQLAERFGMSVNGVWKVCTREGVKPARDVQPHRARALTARRALRGRWGLAASPVRGAPTKDAIAGLLLTTDRTYQSIAEQFGVTRQWVQQVWNGMRRLPRYAGNRCLEPD